MFQTMSRYRLNPAAEILPDRRAASGLSVEVAGCDDSAFHLEPEEAIRAIEYCTEPRELDDVKRHLRRTTSIDGSRIDSLLSALTSRSILVSESPPRSLTRWFDNNWTPSLSYHARSTDAPDRESLSEQRPSLREPPEVTEEDGADRIELPTPETPPDARLEEVIVSRQTCRNFEGEPVERSTVSEMLYYGLHRAQQANASGRDRKNQITDHVRGARPIEAYPMVLEEGEIARGVYRYSPEEHELVEVRPSFAGIEAEEVPTRLMKGYDTAAGAGVVFLLTVDLARYQRSFPYARALRGMYANVSRIGHRLILTAVADDYEVFQGAALAHSFADELLRTDGSGERALYMVAVGRGNLNRGLGS